MKEGERPKEGTVMEVSPSEVKSKLNSILARVEKGEEVVILLHGREVARIVPPKLGLKALPSLKQFRASIRVSGEPLSSTIEHMRNQERY